MAAVKSNSDAILMQFNRCKQEASACSSSVGRAYKRLARPRPLSDPRRVAAKVEVDRLRVLQVSVLLNFYGGALLARPNGEG